MPVVSPEFFLTCGGIYLCSSAAHVFNQIIERKTDALMIRTCNRPLAAGNLSPNVASIIGLGCAAAGSSLLHLTGSHVAAPLALVNIALYSCIYTPLKRKTEWNTHVGSVVGAIPPLIGYAAAGGGLTCCDPWLLFGIMYVWQLPHFYSLAWLHRKDYLNAGLQMFGTKDESGKTTALACVKWVTVLNCLPLVYSYAGLISPNMALWTLLPNLYINYKCVKYFDSPNKLEARSFFINSLWHVLMLVGITSYCVATEDQEDKQRRLNS
ncbi:protohem IX farnesyltransferase like protein [Babesia gibsoni]|uniref:Protoheme IX farnesyltransferase, mitochondrial n=1 Tax=Babesia gibsoni TaxID=33632 RepID=A0AAD8LHF5_BABGI|nr:protohem IX farnesyltransferase like protein [Babesia gibsoni]